MSKLAIVVIEEGPLKYRLLIVEQPTEPETVEQEQWQ